MLEPAGSQPLAATSARLREISALIGVPATSCRLRGPALPLVMSDPPPANCAVRVKEEDVVGEKFASASSTCR
jgi:hypothetical protein